MQIYLPIAEMAVSAEVIISLGAVVGFLSGVFGIGGGFLATPFLIFLGIPPSIAVGTQANQLVASSITGALTQWSRGNLDRKMGNTMMLGAFAGATLGIMLFKLLQHLGQIDVVISVLYVVLLLTIGGMMLIESIKTALKKSGDGGGRSPFWNRVLASWPRKTHYPVSKLYISLYAPLAVGFVGGLLVSIMGIGGGFILVPAMIYILGMPSILVAGTSMYQIVFTTAFATLMHAITNKTLDLMLAALLIIGGVIGTQIGIRAAKYIKGVRARILLALMMIGVAVKLGWDLFIPPLELFTTDIW